MKCPYHQFESDVLLLKLNGGDIGDINHSRKLTKKIDEALYKFIKKMYGRKLR